MEPKLTIELVPRKAWGRNLRTLLSRDQWDVLRRATYKSAKYRCEVCGGVGPEHPVECHEVWCYDDVHFIQYLVRLVALCPSCHEVKHFGFAKLKENGDRALSHLSLVNSWSKKQSQDYVRDQFKIWSERSTHEWTLDLAFLDIMGIRYRIETTLWRKVYTFLKQLPRVFVSGKSIQPSPIRFLKSVERDRDHNNANTVIVVDFETTSLQPGEDGRIIEIGAVRLENGRICGEFSCLVNPGIPIPSDITNLTGITKRMLRRDGMDPTRAMQEFHRFSKGFDLVAHSASFDKKFLEYEMALAGEKPIWSFTCSMLVSRRVYPDERHHTLAALSEMLGIRGEEVFHRALNDARVTTRLWLAILRDFGRQYEIETLPFPLIDNLERIPKRKVGLMVSRWRKQQ
ncbi:MAG: exonuclease domain-containing protein [Gammaproteobacteria bacterium]